MAEQILIVEDDLAMSSGIRDMLEMNGYRVRLAENGVEGLKALELFPPDLIISDIMMPEMDGFEFLEAVRAHERTRDIPVVILSSSHQMKDVDRCRDLGVVAYLNKPLDSKKLASDGNGSHLDATPYRCSKLTTTATHLHG